jgi:hypothetical protein
VRGIEQLLCKLTVDRLGCEISIYYH